MEYITFWSSITSQVVSCLLKHSDKFTEELEKIAKRLGYLADLKKDAFQKLEVQKKGATLPFFTRIRRILHALFRLTPKRLAMYRTAIQQRIFFQAI